MTPLRVALCNDFAEEGWPSMDRVAGMLYAHLRRSHRRLIEPDLVCPPFARRATRLPGATGLKLASDADRFLNRFHDYPQALARIARQYDVFHIVDHSYAHLVHALPPDRAVVTCHDLDAFRSVIAPGDEPRSAAFRRKTTQILDGLRKAALVTCDTAAIRDDLVSRRLVHPARAIVVYLGVSENFSPQPVAAADEEAERVVPRVPGAIELLHVGSSVARKRLDVLLRASARLAERIPNLRLVRVGDPLTMEQQDLVRGSALEGRYAGVSGVSEAALASLYRRASVVLLPSEREGFGLPIVEALACGVPVIASDIAVLREVGGSAVEYCAVGDVTAWVSSTEALLHERAADPSAWSSRQERGILRARRFSWTTFADTLASMYVALGASVVPAMVPQTV